MPVWKIAAAFACLSAATAGAEDFRVRNEHPRLLLAPRRLRLLQRERERLSIRWKNFETVAAAPGELPEEGFARALYYRATGDRSAGRRAVQWALAKGDSPRQLALVFDWCQPVLEEGEAAALAARLEQFLGRPPSEWSIPEMRSRVFAAVAVAERSPKLSEQELDRAVNEWWGKRIVPALAAGRDAVPRGDLYPLFELLDAVRDSLGQDLRQPVAEFFARLPAWDLLSYYPAPYSQGGYDYRMPWAPGAAPPEARRAEMARVAELAMVAYDTNALETQYLQGWLTHERFLLRTPYGAPYEFLWGNPYQPGLSYDTLPPLFRDALLGKLFVRSGWDDGALWVGCSGGELQIFSSGKARVAAAGGAAAPIRVGGVLIVPGLLDFAADGAERVFVVGLAPSRVYTVTAAGKKSERRADPGGILEVELPRDFQGRVRLRAN
jgi:hypothetical protein